MPFRTLRWVDGAPEIGIDEPQPVLRELDARWFVLENSFCYVVRPPDPDARTTYVIPGADAPTQPVDVRRIDRADGPIVIPPHKDGRTDLASVPSFLWWLIASYGNHTQATLLHDALYVDKGQQEAVTRAGADRLFLAAMREPAGKQAPFRHWLMWVGVSLFGTMRRWVGAVFLLQVLVLWGLLAAAVAWAWGPWTWGIDWPTWRIVVVVVGGVVAFCLFVFLLGFSWRAGVDMKYGWLWPDLLMCMLIGLAVGFLWGSKDWWSPFTLALVAGALMLLGLLWGAAVDPTLRMWLWPTGVVGLQIAALPLLFIGIALGLVWLLDLGAAVAKAQRKDALGREQEFELPRLPRLRPKV